MVNKTNKQGKDIGRQISKLTKGIKAEVRTLKDLYGESVTLEDHQLGLSFSVVSHRFDAVELTRLGLDSFKLIRDEKLNKIPLGVN